MTIIEVTMQESGFFYAIILIILTLVTFVVLTMTITKKDTSILNKENESFDSDVMSKEPLLRLRAEGVMLAWYDTIESIISTPSDQSALYSIWSGNMFKRGLSYNYISPTLFEQVQDLYEQDELGVAEIIPLIEVSYVKEKKFREREMIMKRERPIAPICLN